MTGEAGFGYETDEMLEWYLATWNSPHNWQAAYN